jgi:DNA-binding XRE family transcriptional regulator
MAQKLRMGFIGINTGKNMKEKLNKIKIEFIGMAGFHCQYKIINLKFLEEFRKKKIFTKKNMAKYLNVSLRTYEHITYNKPISTRVAAKIENFIRKENGLKCLKL